MVFDLLPGLVVQLGHVEMNLVAQSIAPWKPCAPAWREADERAPTICAEKALDPRQCRRALHAFSAPQRNLWGPSKLPGLATKKRKTDIDEQGLKHVSGPTRGSNRNLQN